MAASLQSATRTAIRQLKPHSDTAALDVELLLSHVLKRDRVWLFTHPERILAPQQELKFAALLARRLRGEPLAYLTGERDFYEHRFRVNRHTLIPRPETEVIVERVLALTDADQPFQLLDLGTGCGPIALSIALKRPNAMIVATDVSDKALDVARANAHRLRVPNVEFCTGSWYACVPGRRFDIVVSNPPYVERDPETPIDPGLRYEPPLALFAGRDGLDGVQAVAGGALDALYPGGTVLLEHGAGQAHAVGVILSAHGLAVEGCHKDLAGRDRVTEASA